MPEQLTVQAPAQHVVVAPAPAPAVLLVALPPVYAHGLGMVLQNRTGGCTVVPDLAQLPGQLADREPVVVVVPAAHASVVLALAQGPTQHPVVVLLEAATPEACRQAVRAGVTGVITAGDALEDVVLVLTGAARGATVLRRELLRSLCRPDSPPPSLTATEQTWLRQLAAGATVSGLARGCGYSEREMYRRLSAVYQRLGARTRTEALVLAERVGLLDSRT